jgi:2-methylcitrate dehydratase PrpD
MGKSAFPSEIEQSRRTDLLTASTAHSDEPLAARLSRAALAMRLEDLAPEVVEKAKLCLLDFIGCALEARDLPWSRQARASVSRLAQGATLIGEADTAPHADAAFANAVMGHGLVREDMHAGSISHLGIVVLPALLSLAQYRRVTGRELIAAIVVGYETGGQIGRAAMDSETARIHRPTGIAGPPAAAAAGARLLALSAEATATAVAIAGNTPVGFNQWAHTGGSEMFFHAGFAARDAITAVLLAQAGAFASPSALDGEAGLFASLGKREAAGRVELFHAQPEILAVYHKPVPACNFAQTASQAALQVHAAARLTPERIARIVIRVPRAGALYPGCDYSGPFAHVLQAKMSIQYNVVAALLEGAVSEKNFTRLADPRLRQLLGATSLEIDDEMSRAYPAKQGGEVEVRDREGKVHRARLADVVHATADEVRSRFREAGAAVLGANRAADVEQAIDRLDHSEDAARLPSLLRAPAP